MLRKVGESAWPISEKDAVVSIKDASYPIPFPQGLEFNSPAHGCWNIVHTGMLIPEAHQIYVCADNCMRGVVLTAAEMHAEDRFSFVIVEEQNLLSGNLEDVTIEGTADILRKLKEREEKTGQKMPKAVLLFTVCLHHFLGCDLERIYRELELEVQLNILHWGDVVLVGTEPELSSSFGTQVRALAPHVVLATLVNGAKKYLPSSDAYDRVTYEAMNSSFGRGADTVLFQAISSAITNE